VRSDRHGLWVRWPWLLLAASLLLAGVSGQQVPMDMVGIMVAATAAVALVGMLWPR